MQPYHNDSSLQRQYGYLLSAANCSDIACLRSLSEHDLANAVNLTYFTAYAHGDYGFGDFYYGPYVDGNIVRDLPSQEFKTGHFTKVPLMTNREGYEGVAFSNTSEMSTSEMQQDLQILFPNAKQSFFDRLYQLYPRTAYNSTFYQRQQIFGDFAIACPSYYFGSAVSDYSNHVYKMIFDAGSQLHGALIPFTETVNLEGEYGFAFCLLCSSIVTITHPHLADVILLIMIPAGESNNATLASIIRSYYVSFATSLGPNAVAYTHVSRPYWPSYQSDDSGNFTVLGVTYGGIEAVPDMDASPQCDFLHSESYVVRN